MSKRSQTLRLRRCQWTRATMTFTANGGNGRYESRTRPLGMFALMTAFEGNSGSYMLRSSSSLYGLACVKTHTSAKCRKHSSPARHRTSRVQYDLTRPLGDGRGWQQREPQWYPSASMRGEHLASVGGNPALITNELDASGRHRHRVR